MISVIDYGVANLGSLLNMLRKLGLEAQVVSTPEMVMRADKVILPGVGAFDNGVRHLVERGLSEPLIRHVKENGVPILGICLGMQLLGEGSEEGVLPGLRLIEGHCIRFLFQSGSPYKVPHMGWNVLNAKRDSDLLSGLGPKARFYFTHSYHFVCDNPGDVLATATHGIEFTAILQRGNVVGVQFHPEKSHRFGMSILQNFGAM